MGNVGLNKMDIPHSYKLVYRKVRSLRDSGTRELHMDIWETLQDEKTREILAWIAGGFAAVVTALWTVFTFFFKGRFGLARQAALGDMAVSPLVAGENLLPLDAFNHPAGTTPEGDTVFAGGFIARLTLYGESTKGTKAAVDGIYLDVVNFIAGPDPRLSCWRREKLAAGFGAAAEFRVALKGSKVSHAGRTLIGPDNKKQERRAVSANFLDVQPNPDTLIVNAGELVTIVVNVIAQVDGLYELQLRLTYLCRAGKKHYQSPSIFVFAEGMGT